MTITVVVSRVLDADLFSDAAELTDAEIIECCQDDLSTIYDPGDPTLTTWEVLRS